MFKIDETHESRICFCKQLNALTSHCRNFILFDSTSILFNSIYFITNYITIYYILYYMTELNSILPTTTTLLPPATPSNRPLNCQDQSLNGRDRSLNDRDRSLNDQDRSLKKVHGLGASHKSVAKWSRSVAK